jgi:hypothetical protein
MNGTEKIAGGPRFYIGKRRNGCKIEATKRK